MNEDLVSRRHALLTMDDRGYFKLEDLGSKNGITYQGRMVRRLNLLDGDIFSIGKTEITFHAKIERYANAPAPTPERAAPPRDDSVMADVDVPEPSLDPETDGSDIGWDPSRADPAPPKPQASEPAEEPPAPVED